MENSRILVRQYQDNSITQCNYSNDGLCNLSGLVNGHQGHGQWFFTDNNNVWLRMNSRTRYGSLMNTAEIYNEPAIPDLPRFRMDTSIHRSGFQIAREISANGKVVVERLVQRFELSLVKRDVEEFHAHRLEEITILDHFIDPGIKPSEESNLEDSSLLISPVWNGYFCVDTRKKSVASQLLVGAVIYSSNENNKTVIEPGKLRYFGIPNSGSIDLETIHGKVFRFYR